MTGSGTLTDPYIIWDVDDLQAMENDLTAYYELANDIDASATSGWNGDAGFVPISDFIGELDGKDHTISNLYINRLGEYHQALFGRIGDLTSTPVVLKNIKMTGVDITSNASYVAALVGYIRGTTCTISNCSSTGSVTMMTPGYNYTGGLIGYMTGGIVKDCYSTCTVSGVDRVGGLIAEMGDGDVDRCYATGNVSASRDFGGGLTGYLKNGSIDKCYATGAVTVGDDYGGGFVGNIDNGIVSDCYARGSVTVTDVAAGGFAGMCYGTLDNCYSTGAVSSEGVQWVGGFCGSGAEVRMTNCFWDTQTSGQSTSDGGTGKTTAQMTTESTFTGAGWDFTTPIWYINRTINDGYPAFIGVVRRIKGNPNIDQRMFQHVERMGR